MESVPEFGSFWSGPEIMERTADFMLMQFELPGGQLWPIAVLLFDPPADKLYVRYRKNLPAVSDPQDALVLKLSLSQLETEAASESGSGILRVLESTLSNSLRITGRTGLPVDNIDSALDELYSRHIHPTVETPHAA